MNQGCTRIVWSMGGMVLSILLGFPLSPAWADDGHGHSGGYRHAMGRHGEQYEGRHHHHLLRHLLRHQQEIGLTDEQVGKLKALALDQDRTKIRAHADVMVAERELRSLVWDDKADLSAIQTRLKERASLEANERFMEIKGRRELLAVLTPEQRDKLKAMRGQMRESHRARVLRPDPERSGREGAAEGAPSGPAAEPYGGNSALQAG